MSAAAIIAGIYRGVIRQASNMVNTSNFVPSNNAFVRSEQAKAVYHRVK